MVTENDIHQAEDSAAATQKLSGAAFERVIVERNSEYFQSEMAHVAKCPVSAVRTKDDWVQIQSYPDFEGVIPEGRQFVFDAKVCSQASFDLSKFREESKGQRVRQLRHMRRRSRFQVPCFFLIHWNARDLKTRSLPAQTFVFPVSEQMEFWQRFLAAETKSLTRKDCEDFGYRVEWNCLGKGRKPRPDYLAAIQSLFGRPLKKMSGTLEAAETGCHNPPTESSRHLFQHAVASERR